MVGASGPLPHRRPQHGVEANSKSDEEQLFGNGVHVRDRAYALAFTDEPQTALLTDF